MINEEVEKISNFKKLGLLQMKKKINLENLSPPIVGVDEAGRGALAGPVCAGAVILKNKAAYKDSKSLNERQRAMMAEEIFKNHQAALGWASSEEIDRYNILQASLLAMKRAVLALKLEKASLLIDGKYIIPDFNNFFQIPVIKGDSFIDCISAASITAKHFRDQKLKLLAQKYPQYGFEKHKGYPTFEHKEAIKKWGRTSIHRKTFSGVKEAGEAECFL